MTGRQIPNRIKAVVCSNLSADFSGVGLSEIETPRCGDGQVLIRTRSAALNFPDILMCEGGYQFKPPLPFVPGMEIAGDIVEVGGGVAGLSVGDAVMAGVRTGGLSQYCVAAAEAVRSKPAPFSYDEAAGYTTASLTAYVSLVRRADLQRGEVLLVHGAAGGVGLAAVALGAALGARVFATASTAEKRALVLQYGAEHALPPTGFRDQVKDLTDGHGADVIYDPVGGDVFDESVRAIAWGGRLLVVGFASGRIPAVSANMPLIKGFSVVGVRAGEYGRRHPEKGRENTIAIDRFAEQGQLRPHIGAALPLEKAVEGLALLKDRAALGKVVITID